MSVQTEEIQISTSAGETMGAYLARPEGEEKLPAVLVFMEIFGVNDHIRDVTRRVAAEGYVALAPDYFHRTGPGIELAYDEAGMAEGMTHLGQLEADQMIADARDSIAYLRGRSDVVEDRIGAMGFCIGGHMTYLTACETDIVAAASLRGRDRCAARAGWRRVDALPYAEDLTGRIHCYFGAQDAMIPMGQVDAVQRALADAGTDCDVRVYEEADHGFHCDQRASYHEASARDAWSHTLELFASKLRG